jgi:hypothetical protein
LPPLTAAVGRRWSPPRRVRSRWRSGGESFFFGGQEINFDGWLDLLFMTEQGAAKSKAESWVYDPAADRFRDFGEFPMFRVNAAYKRLSTCMRRHSRPTTPTALLSRQVQSRSETSDGRGANRRTTSRFGEPTRAESERDIGSARYCLRLGRPRARDLVFSVGIPIMERRGTQRTRSFQRDGTTRLRGPSATACGIPARKPGTPDHNTRAARTRSGHIRTVEIVAKLHGSRRVFGR